MEECKGKEARKKHADAAYIAAGKAYDICECSGSCYALAICHLDGTVSKKKALVYLEKGAESDDGDRSTYDCMLELGRMYLEGDGVRPKLRSVLEKLRFV